MTIWNPRANELFLAARVLNSPDERSQFLDRMCADGGGVYVAPGGFASADPWTFVFWNDASTSDDDMFGNLV